MSEVIYEGGCHCGKVRFELTGDVQGAQICHCSICRQLQGSSLGQLASFFAKDDFKIVKGSDSLANYLSAANYSRIFCKKCGSRIGLTFEKANFEVPFVVVYPTMIDQLKNAGTLPDKFKPQRHIFYGDKLHVHNDGVEKYADMPEEFGGSGKKLNDEGEAI